jgi:hypothetical protein
MGGYGSGRYDGRPTVESAMRLDIDSMMHWGAIQPGFHLGGEMRLHQLYGGDIDVKFESHAGDPWNSWLCLRYSMTDYCSGEQLKIDDKVYLAPTRPHFGGLRWWFVCPHLNRRGAQAVPAARRPLRPFCCAAHTLHSLAAAALRQGRYEEAEGLHRRADAPGDVQSPVGQAQSGGWRRR